MSSMELERDMFPGYEIYEQIGAGGGGRVFRGYHKNLKKNVVIKRIHDNITDEAKMRADADMLKGLHHTYIPQVFDYIEKDGVGYTVMDYISGDSFGNLLKQGREFSFQETIKYARQLCQVVDYLHSQNPPVIHGDIKPDNIMLTESGDICLIDFNVSGISSNGKAYTDGYTPGYGAPEQYKQFRALMKKMKKESLENKNLVFNDNATEIMTAGDDLAPKVQVKEIADDKSRLMTIDKRSDVYSMAATIFHIYTGHQLKRGRRIVLDADTSEALLYILNKGLADKPQTRYQDAGQMLAAFNNLYKYDGRYKSMVAGQFVAWILVIIMFTVGVLMVITGYQKTGIEKLSKYDDYVVDMEKATRDMDDDAINEAYAAALGVDFYRPEAYCQMAEYYFITGDYQKTIDYIEDDVLSVSELYDTGRIDDIYYILGESYFRLEKYKEANNNFSTAIKYKSDNPACYVSDAVALAKLGDVEKAEKILDKAEEFDASSESIFLVKGEIYAIEEDFESAMEAYNDCIDCAEDEYILYLAYKELSDVMLEGEPSLNDYKDNVKMLKEAVKKLSDQQKWKIYEQIAIVAIKAKEQYPDSAIDDTAKDALNTIIENGWAVFSDYETLVNVYIKAGQYEKAENILNEAEEKYDGYYRVYMLYAFVELEKQNSIPSSDREYETFAKYYKKAEDAYKDEKKQNDGDMDMLKDYYNDVVNSGWLE